MRWLGPRATCTISLASAACTGTSSLGDASSSYDASLETLPNGALHFDGLADYGTTGTANFPYANVAQTISLWVNYAAGSGTQVFLSLRTDEVSGVNLGIRKGQIAAWTVSKDEVLVQTQALPSISTWHNVAFVIDHGDGGGLLESLYVDGVLSAMGTQSPDKLIPVSSWLGSLDGSIDLFAGDMDEIRIWNIARSSSDIAQDMSGKTAPDAHGLVLYLDCDAIHGTRVVDNSGNGNDLTLGGGDPTRMPTLVPSTVPQ